MASRAVSLTTEFARKHPDKFSRILRRGEGDDIVRILDSLPPTVAASIVSRLPVSRIGAMLASGQHQPERWLTDAPFDDAIALLSRIPREQCLTLVNSLKNRERRKRLLQYLKYPTHSVGALVSDVPIRITSDTPAADALADLRTLDSADPKLLVVVHPDGRYCGMLDSWQLLVRESTAGPVSDYTTPVPAIYPETSLASAVGNPNWHEHNWLPVVDHQQRILGGVSRASVLAAAARYQARGDSGNDLFTSLAGDLVYLCGELLARLLTQRGIR